MKKYDGTYDSSYTILLNMHVKQQEDSEVLNEIQNQLENITGNTCNCCECVEDGVENLKEFIDDKTIVITEEVPVEIIKEIIIEKPVEVIKEKIVYKEVFPKDTDANGFYILSEDECGELYPIKISNPYKRKRMIPIHDKKKIKRHFLY